MSWLASVKRLVVRDSCSLRWVARAVSLVSIGGAVVAGVGFGAVNVEVDFPLAVAAAVDVLVGAIDDLSGRRCRIVVVSSDDTRLFGSSSVTAAPLSTGSNPSHISSSSSASCASSSSRSVLVSTSSLIQSNLSLTFSYLPLFFVRSVVRSCRIAGALTAGNDRSILFIRVCA